MHIAATKNVLKGLDQEAEKLKVKLGWWLMVMVGVPTVPAVPCTQQRP